MKQYIGQGKTNEKYDTIVDVVINMEDADKHIFQGEKGRYLRFSVGQRKEADKFGNTHSVSVWTPDEQPAPAAVNEPAPEKPKGKKGKKA